MVEGENGQIAHWHERPKFIWIPAGTIISPIGSNACAIEIKHIVARRSASAGMFSYFTITE